MKQDPLEDVFAKPHSEEQHLLKPHQEEHYASHHPSLLAEVGRFILVLPLALFSDQPSYLPQPTSLPFDYSMVTILPHSGSNSSDQFDAAKAPIDAYVASREFLDERFTDQYWEKKLQLNSEQFFELKLEILRVCISQINQIVPATHTLTEEQQRDLTVSLFTTSYGHHILKQVRMKYCGQ